MNHGSTKDTPEPGAKWWFNLRTGLVEHGMKSNALDRVGPFETQEEAQRAPEVLRDRAKAWQKEDSEAD
jgi:hypothetical protein